MNPDHSGYESSLHAAKSLKYTLVFLTLQDLVDMLVTYRVLFIW